MRTACCWVSAILTQNRYNIHADGSYEPSILFLQEEREIAVIGKLFGQSQQDSVQLGDKTVQIPKLTPEKYKALFERIETLPVIIMRVLANQNSDDFVATVITGASLALDEAVSLVAVLADIDEEYLSKHADLNEITDFIRLTFEKNDLQRTIKNFRAVLGQIRTGLSPGDGKAD